MTNEELQQQLLEAQEKCKDLELTINEYKEKESKYEETIKTTDETINSLRQHNNYLFQRVQQDPEENKPTNKSTTSIADVVNSFNK